MEKMSRYRNSVTQIEPIESNSTLRLKSTVFLGYTDIAAGGIRALLGIDMKKEFYTIDVPSLQGSDISCVSPNPVDPRDQDFAPIQVWNLKYEQFSVVLINTVVRADRCHHVCGRILDLCKESLIDRLVVLSASRVDIPSGDIEIYENPINIKRMTACPSLPENTRINDPFLCTLIQMIMVDYMPTSVLLIPSHRACTGQAKQEDGSQQVISTFQRTLNEVTKISFNEDFSLNLTTKFADDNYIECRRLNLIYKGRRNKETGTVSMYN